MCNKCLICILNLLEQKTVYSWMQSVTVVTLHNILILHILFCLSATLLWLILLAEASTLVKLSLTNFLSFSSTLTLFSASHSLLDAADEPLSFFSLSHGLDLL